jgi:uncharacterized membrane protein YkvA (DUF1232 family)
LYRSLSDPDVPWYVKFLLGIIVAYIISPIDIIPDFIPVFGLLDEAILVPIGISLALKLMPVDVMEKYQQEEGSFPRQFVITGIVLVLLFWGMTIAAVLLLI